MKKQIVWLLLPLLVACGKQVKVTDAHVETITIDASLDALQDSAYLAQLAPVKEQLEAELSVVLGQAPEALTVHQPECTMLNWASEALLRQARLLYDRPVDLAIVNIGGMRCEWAAGPITRRSVYELMPFDNELVVLILKGEDLLELCQVFAEDGGQGVAGLRMQAEDKQLIEALVDGVPVLRDRVYTVATSDYLMGGTDHMTPLTRHLDCWRSNQKIRDLYIADIEQQGTVIAQIDGRMDIR